MTTTLTQSGRDVLLTDPTERQQASDLLRKLASGTGKLAFEARAERAVVAVPPELAGIMVRVLEVLASGGTVTVGSLPQELTTTVAAEQLGVSRPTLMKMIRNGEIAARQVGSHHRLKTSDVLAAKRAKLERQMQAFDELRAIEDQLV